MIAREHGKPIVLTAKDFVTRENGQTWALLYDDHAGKSIGYGHSDKEAFATLVNAYDSRPPINMEAHGFTAADVHHGYIAATAAADNDNYYEWYYDTAAAASTLTTPVTWIEYPTNW